MSGTVVCIRRPSATWTVCRCEPCTKSAQRVRKFYDAGVLPPSPSEQAWRKIDRMLAAGYTAGAIASSAGLSVRTVMGAIRNRETNPKRKLSRVAAAAILSAPEPTHGLIPAVGSMRRLRALTAIGWDLSSVADRTGIPLATLSTIRTGKATTSVNAPRAAAIREAYEAMHMTPGTSSRARSKAQRNGWSPPLAWDERNIDDADARPVGTRPERQLLDLDEWMHLYRLGVEPEEAARRCGVSLSAVDRRARREGRADVAAIASPARSEQRRREDMAS